MENAPILMLLILVIAIMGGYYYFKRAQRRDSGNAEAVQPAPGEHPDRRP